MRRVACVIVAGSLWHAAGSASGAILDYHFSTLAPPVASIASTARAVDANGDIVGWFAVPVNPGLNNPGGFIATPSAGSYTVKRIPPTASASFQWAQPYDINVGKIVVGQAQRTQDAVAYSFRADASSSTLTQVVSGESEARAINGSGAAAGWRLRSNNDFEAYYRTPAGTLYTLPAAGDPPRESRAFDINASNKVAGFFVERTGSAKAYQGFVTDCSGPEPSPCQPLQSFGLITVENLPAQDWLQEIRPISINDAGHVAATHAVSAGNNGNGTGAGPDINRAFMWSNGKVTELRTTGGFAESFATGISGNDWVVGILRDNKLGQTGFLWAAGQMIDLSKLLLPADWVGISAVHDAYSVADGNDPLRQTGILVGDALVLIDGVVQQRGFAMSLVMQVPEPHIYLMFGIGLIAVGAVRLRRLRSARE